MTTLAFRRGHVPFWPTMGLAVVAWLIGWLVNLPLANWAAYGLLGLERGSQLGDAVAFFMYDVPKVLLLLTGIVTLVSFLRSYVSPERVRRALAGRGVLPGTLAAAGFGIVTPFCSCSAVPLFIGFVEAGVPLGVTFAFLVASPMVNEVAIVLLWGLFGPIVAIVYMLAGLTVAVLAGLVIGRLGLERYVEDYVWSIRSSVSQPITMRLTLPDRLRDAWGSTRSLVWKVLPYVLVGIGIGALIHGFVPTDLVVSIGGSGNPLAVPALVALGVPLYSNAAGTIPIVEALIGKGLPLGSALAFMMAITALSVPELVILRRVMKPRLIAVFVTVVTFGILSVGYLFNALYA
ncbi:MAG: permease [Candidatus Limnocylindria bacterium]